MRLNHFYHSDWGISKTCIVNASTASSEVEKRWPLILWFTYGNKNKSFGVKSGLWGRLLIKSMFCMLKNAVVVADVWERVVVKSDPSSAVGFPDFLEDN